MRLQPGSPVDLKREEFVRDAEEPLPANGEDAGLVDMARLNEDPDEVATLAGYDATLGGSKVTGQASTDDAPLRCFPYVWIHVEQQVDVTQVIEILLESVGIAEV